MTEPSAELDIWSVLAVLLRRWRLILGLPFAVGLVIGVSKFLHPRAWSVSASFSAGDASPQSSSLGALASSLGLSAGRGGRNPPQFYADLVRSREVLMHLADARHPGAGATGDSADLVTYFNI